MVCATVDTNTLLYIYLNKVDVFQLLSERGIFKVVIPSSVVEELKRLEQKLKGKEKIAASFALKIATEKCNIVDFDSEDVDSSLLSVAEEYGCILVTSDRLLIKRAREKKIETAFLRERKKLEFSSDCI